MHMYLIMRLHQLIILPLEAADMVFIPRENAGNRPAMVVELKYNQSADSAINQIKEGRYQGALSGYSDRILLVGVNYDADGKDRKKHTCVIEEG